MNPVLTPELYWLVLTTVMTGLFWIPYILQRIAENGALPALLDPQGLTHMDAPWAQRMMRAHQKRSRIWSFLPHWCWPCMSPAQTLP